MDKRLFKIFALSSAVYFTQGIEGLPSQGLLYYFKETLAYPAQKIMFIESLITLAWLVKPVIGYAIDNFLNKKKWIFLSLILDIGLVLFLGVFQFPIFLLAIFLIINSSNAAVRDVAVDGIMCIEGKKSDITGKIQSIQWISISVAGLLTGIGGGVIAQKWNYKTAFFWLIPAYFIVGLIAHFYREEEKVEKENLHTLISHLKVLLIDKKLLLAGLFIFLYKYSPSFGAPLFFIQRDTFKWSKIWIGALASISTVFGIIGSLLYYKVSQKIQIKKWLYFSVFIGAVTTLSYLYYTPVTAVIYDILYSLAGMFIFLIIMDFMARSTLKGFEAASFALLCSISNLASTASNFSGAILLPVTGLKWLIILSSLTSFLCLPLINKIKE